MHGDFTKKQFITVGALNTKLTEKALLQLSKLEGRSVAVIPHVIQCGWITTKQKQSNLNMIYCSWPRATQLDKLMHSPTSPSRVFMIRAVLEISDEYR